MTNTVIFYRQCFLVHLQKYRFVLKITDSYSKLQIRIKKLQIHIQKYIFIFKITDSYSKV